MPSFFPPALAPLAAALALGGCYKAVKDPFYTPCRISGSSDWRAFVDGASGDSPRVVVTGTVTVPNGSHGVTLERGYLQRLDPPRLQVILRSKPPLEPAEPAQPAVVHRVSESFDAPRNVAGVTVRCGDKILAVIAPLPRET